MHVQLAAAEGGVLPNSQYSVSLLELLPKKTVVSTASICPYTLKS